MANHEFRTAASSADVQDALMGDERATNLALVDQPEVTIPRKRRRTTAPVIQSNSEGPPESRGLRKQPVRPVSRALKLGGAQL